MPSFDMENLNPGTQFEWPGDSGAGVELRILDAEEGMRLRRKHYKIVRELKREDDKKSKRGPAQLVEYEVGRTPNADEAYREDMWDYCIVSFWGFTDEKSGKAIEATRENKIKLMSRSVEFLSFVTDCLEKLGELESAQKEDEEKNSVTSQTGSSEKNLAMIAEADTP